MFRKTNNGAMQKTRATWWPAGWYGLRYVSRMGQAASSSSSMSSLGSPSRSWNIS
jgi:hypothetical protein